MQAPVGKTPVACKNCRHFFNDSVIPFTLKYGKCGLTRNDIPSRVDPVDGAVEKPVVDYSYASTERQSYGDCGMDGNLFELETDRLRLMRNWYAAPVKSTAAYVATLLSYFLAYAVMLILLSYFLASRR
jgi:hypothetical protein